MKTAFIFPGQGSQSVGMAKELYEKRAEARALLDQVNAVLGRDLLGLMFNGPDEGLKETFNTQPALYAAGLAALACAKADGLQAGHYAGHSLGEYCALQAAGVFSFSDGLKLVQARAEAMTAAAKAAPGGMAAILKLDDAVVEQCCAEASAAGPVQAANYNCPGQLVISGSQAGVDKAVELCKAAGGRALPLAVSGAFHSAFMVPAGQALAQAFGSVAWSAPQATVLANVDAAPSASPAEIQAKLVAQLSGAVRWTQSVLRLKSEGVTHYLELGPGKVLAGLVKKIDPGAQAFSAGDCASLEAAVAVLKG